MDVVLLSDMCPRSGRRSSSGDVVFLGVYDKVMVYGCFRVSSLQWYFDLLFGSFWVLAVKWW